MSADSPKVVPSSDKQVDGRLVREWTAWAEGGTDLELEDVNDDDLADLVVNTPGGVVVLWQIFGDFMSARPDRLVTTYPVTEVEVGDVTPPLCRTALQRSRPEM